MFVKLGVAPIAAGAVISAGAAIGGLLGIIQNSLDDSWAEDTVFRSHGRDIHRAMTAIQCMLGGAQVGQPLINLDETIGCPGGTRPTCTASNAQLNEWRTLRDGFGRFYGDVTSKWGDPTDAEAQRLKDYAISFYQFYQRLAPTCKSQGADLPIPPPPPVPKEEEVHPMINALQYTAWIVGGIAVIYVAKTGFEIFGKGR